MTSIARYYEFENHHSEGSVVITEQVLLFNISSCSYLCLNAVLSTEMKQEEWIYLKSYGSMINNLI